MKIIAAVLLGALTFANAAGAKPFKLGSLLGAWVYVAGDTELPNGNMREQFGARPEGILVILPNHWYSHIVMRRDLPKVPGKMLQDAPDALARQIGEGVLAHFGTWTADPKKGTFTVKIVGSSFPNFDGKTQVRDIVKLNRTTLRYVNTLSSAGPGAKVYSTLRRLPP